MSAIYYDSRWQQIFGTGSSLYSSILGLVYGLSWRLQPLPCRSIELLGIGQREELAVG